MLSIVNLLAVAPVQRVLMAKQGPIMGNIVATVRAILAVMMVVVVAITHQENTYEISVTQPVKLVVPFRAARARH